MPHFSKEAARIGLSVLALAGGIGIAKMQGYGINREGIWESIPYVCPDGTSGTLSKPVVVFSRDFTSNDSFDACEYSLVMTSMVKKIIKAKPFFQSNFFIYPSGYQIDVLEQPTILDQATQKGMLTVRKENDDIHVAYFFEYDPNNPACKIDIREETVNMLIDNRRFTLDDVRQLVDIFDDEGYPIKEGPSLYVMGSINSLERARE